MCPNVEAPPWSVALDWSGVWPGNGELRKIPRRFSRAVWVAKCRGGGAPVGRAWFFPLDPPRGAKSLGRK